MIKIAILFLAGLLTFPLAACGNTIESSETQSSQSQTESAVESTAPKSSEATNTTEDTSVASEAPSAEGAESNVLVVYYSATGNTEEAAGYIADLAGGTLFELEPADPYTDEDLNYNDDNSRVSQEYADESLREVELVADTVESWDSYDTVFIGYPIWWGIAAWPVDGFIEANDFTGKTVIPFCTSASSGLGESG